MEQERVKIYSLTKGYKAELLKMFLHEHGITAFSINKQDSNYFFGEIEIYVRRDDVIRAMHLIKVFEN